MKLVRLRFQSIFSFALASGSRSEGPSPRSWVVVGLPPPSDMKVGATAAFGSVVGHDAVKTDKSIVCVTAAGPFGAVVTPGFVDDGPVTAWCGPTCVSAAGWALPMGTRRSPACNV